MLCAVCRDFNTLCLPFFLFFLKFKCFPWVKDLILSSTAEDHSCYKVSMKWKDLKLQWEYWYSICWQHSENVPNLILFWKATLPASRRKEPVCGVIYQQEDRFKISKCMFTSKKNISLRLLERAHTHTITHTQVKSTIKSQNSDNTKSLQSDSILQQNKDRSE